ncbi:XRE family transcriptional regulator [Pseudomonas chlororaphis]|uniref:XRE family transcriptional regulator n=1 Tax=Pseudomonas chlororaphis TaxID=587753 RepID=UPI000F58DDF9|nr:helix-turn-helix transcriptional regulator [Pseudomonas chlororaphis]
MKLETDEIARLSGLSAEPESADPFHERLQRLVRIAGSANALAKRSGISQSGIQRYLKGGEPTRKMLITLAECTGVSLLWLMTGEGSEFAQQPAAKAPPVEDDTYAYVPLYDARCSAGHGAWNEASKVLAMLAFTAYSLRKQGLTPSRLSAVRVDGDSMSGLFEDGDTVMIDHGRNQLEAEAVYVIRLDDHLYAKRLQRLLDGSIRIISENNAYRDIMVSKNQLNDLEIIGRVVWAGGWL